MSEFVTVAKRTELKPGGRLIVEAEGATVAIFSLGNEIFALNGTCPHKGGPLGAGHIEGQTVYCPLHGWGFDLRTGACGDHPELPANCYEVRISGEDVQVRLKESI